MPGFINIFNILLTLGFLKTSAEFQHTVFDELNKYGAKSQFIFENENYNDWSQWSKCFGNCKKIRQRICHRINWQGDSKSFCRVDIIKEVASCTDHLNCAYHDIINISMNTLASLPETCGWKPELRQLKHKIHGGRAAVPNSWPWMLSFGYQGDSGINHICGATLLSPNWAITAAHCVRSYILNEPQPGKLIRIKYHYAFVTANNYHRNQHDKDELNVYISHVILHPSFRHSSLYTDYDLVLLLLETSIKPGPTLGFACLTDNKDFRLPRDAMCYALGWGRQSSQQSLFPQNYDNRLQEVELSLASFNACKAYYGNIYINDTIHVCAGGNNKDTCAGDSGGGLYCVHPNTKKWMLYGIVSFGSNAGCGESYGVYARLTSAVQWIDDTIRSSNRL